MKITTENYTIESNNHGFDLTVKLPSASEKSKTGFTEKTTFHASLKQVAAKMVNYEIMHADAKDVFALADKIEAGVIALSSNLERTA